MGWVKQETMTDDELFEALTNVFHNSAEILRGKRTSQSGSVYEYLTDYIRDYYDVTLAQCDRVSKRIAKHYEIEHFYYNQ